MKIKKLFTGISLIEKKFDRNQTYYYLKTPNVSIIVAKTKNKFLVISQKRIPINKVTYEFPGGIIDNKSNPMNSAKTELYEETGYKCIRSPQKLFSIYPEPGRLDCKYFCFFTDKIIKINKPEKGIKLHLFSKSKILEMIKKDKFDHACHVYAFLAYLNKHDG